MVHEMKIDAKQPIVRTVDISKEELSDAVVHCAEISLIDMVELLRRKFGYMCTYTDDVFIKDGKWYWQRVNDAGNVMTTPMSSGEVTPEHIKIYEEIDMLREAMVMNKLKGGK